MFGRKIKYFTFSGLLCMYFSHQNTHTTRMTSVSQTRYQTYHSAQIPILSSRVQFLMSTSFSQSKNTYPLFPTILFPFSSPSPTTKLCGDAWKLWLALHDLNRISFFMKSPLTHPYFLLYAISVPYIYSYICMYYTVLYLLSHLFPLLDWKLI